MTIKERMANITKLEAYLQDSDARQEQHEYALFELHKEIDEIKTELYEVYGNGRLVVLPCKVGDTVYELSYKNKCDICADNKYGKCFYDGNATVICKKDKWWISEFKTTSIIEIVKLLNHFGKTVFLTKAEAEKVLKEQEDKP